MEGSKKELDDFLVSLEEYSPTIPDEVLQYFLSRTGFQCNDPRVIRLIGLAAQKLISDIANDALQHCKIRQAAKKQKRLVLTMEDLSQSLKEYGITVRRPEYYFDGKK